MRPVPESNASTDFGLNTHPWHSESAGTGWKGIDICRSSPGARVIHRRHGTGIPVWSPGIGPAIAPLGCILPLPDMRQPLPSPSGVSARILNRDPGHRLVAPTIGEGSVAPIAEEVVLIGRIVVVRVDELFELGVGDRRAVDKEARYLQQVAMVAARRRL